MNTPNNVQQGVASFTKKLVVLKVFTGVIVVAVIAAVIYLVYKKFQELTSSCPNGTVYSDEYQKCVPSCPSGYTYNDDDKVCVPSCGTNAFFNKNTGFCECIAGLKGNPNVKCECEVGRYINGACSLTGTVASCEANKLHCAWSSDPNKCFQVQSSCGTTPAVDPVTGIINPNADIAVRCGATATVCLSQKDPDYYRAQTSTTLDELCRSSVCTKLPECAPSATGTRNFSFFDTLTSTCAVQRNCSNEESDLATSVVGFDNSLLKKKTDPNNPGKCIDLTYTQLKDICENDSNGCPYGYTYDAASSKCRSPAGAVVTPGLTGGRQVNSNKQLSGLSCVEISAKYVIFPQFENASATDVAGTFYIRDQGVVQNVMWQYAVFPADSQGRLIPNTTPGVNWFVPSLLGRADITQLDGTTGNYPRFQFEFNISGMPTDPYLNPGSKYRVFIYGLNQLDGKYNIVYGSWSANNAPETAFTGDLLPVAATAQEAPSGIRLNLMITPSKSIANTVINTTYETPNILDEVTKNMLEDVQTAAANPGSFEPVEYAGFNFGLATCPKNICGEIFDRMLSIIAWDITSILTQVPVGKFLKFYVVRNNPPVLTTSEQIGEAVKPPAETYIGTVVDIQIKKAYIADLQPVNNVFLYQVATVIADNNDPITQQSYMDYYKKNQASAFRIVTVLYPQYNKAVCNSIIVDGTPPFMIQYNPFRNADGTPVSGKGGFCERPPVALGNSSVYSDWYCNSDENRKKTFDLTSGIYVWDSNDNKCVKVLPNRTPLVNYQAVKDKVTGSLTVPEWSSGVDVEITSRAGCDSYGNCPRIGDDVTAYYNLEGTSTSISDMSLKHRLKTADVFGTMFVDGWQGQQNQAVVDNAVSNLFDNPATSNPQFYKNYKGGAADPTLNTLLDCDGNNSCGQLAVNTSSGFKHSAKTTMKWFPKLSDAYPGSSSANYQTTGNQVYCNNKGGFGYTRRSDNKVSGGKCDCDSSSYGDRCEFNVVRPPNCIECNDKTCTTGCKTCALYNPDMPNNLQKYLRKIDIPSGSMSALNPGNQECVFNRNATAWADIVGLACHNSKGSDGWGCRPNFADNYRLLVDRSSVDSTGHLNKETANFNGCGKDQSSLRQFANQSSTNKITSAYTGPTGNRKVYDFSEVDPSTLDEIRGPAALLNFKSGNTPNNTDLNISYPVTPYGIWVAKTMQDNCTATGNSLGNVTYQGDITFPLARNYLSYNKL